MSDVTSAMQEMVEPEVLLDPGKFSAWPKRLRTLKDGRLIVLGGLARVPADSLTRHEYSRILEPLLIVVLGGAVGGMVISLYLPMFDIIKLVGNNN